MEINEITKSKQLTEIQFQCVNLSIETNFNSLMIALSLQLKEFQFDFCRMNNVTFISSISFMFCGFIVTWMNYATLGFAIIFLPLALFSIEKYFSFVKGSISYFGCCWYGWSQWSKLYNLVPSYGFSTT